MSEWAVVAERTALWGLLRWRYVSLHWSRRAAEIVAQRERGAVLHASAL